MVQTTQQSHDMTISIFMQVCSIGCLHNFCINERLMEKGNTGVYCPKNLALSPEEVVLCERAADYEGRELTVNCEAP